MGKLIIDGNSVYELDEECMREKERRGKEQKQERDDGKPRRNGNRNFLR